MCNKYFNTENEDSPNNFASDNLKKYGYTRKEGKIVSEILALSSCNNASPKPSLYHEQKNEVNDVVLENNNRYRGDDASNASRGLIQYSRNISYRVKICGFGQIDLMTRVLQPLDLG